MVCVCVLVVVFVRVLGVQRNKYGRQRCDIVVALVHTGLLNDNTAVEHLLVTTLPVLTVSL